MNGKTKKLLSKRKISARKIDKKTNTNNNKLMMDKILSYSPTLLDGVEKYIDAHKNFWLLIVLGILLRDFPLIALPCCLLAMFFSVRMFQLIKYKSIYSAVKKLAKDLSLRGIYDQNKVDIMLNDFGNKYGQDTSEYEELTKVFNSYRDFVLKIESILKSVKINTNEKQQSLEECDLPNTSIVTSINKGKDNLRIITKIDQTTEEFNLDNIGKEFDDKLSVLYRKKDGEIKRINRAIEFFDDENDNSNEKKNAVILKSNGKKNDKLTVYLYKKDGNLQKNAL